MAQYGDRRFCHLEHYPDVNLGEGYLAETKLGTAPLGSLRVIEVPFEVKPMREHVFDVDSALSASQSRENVRSSAKGLSGFSLLMLPVPPNSHRVGQPPITSFLGRSNSAPFPLV